MNIHIKNGKLSTGSIYKLFFVGWATSWLAFMGLIFGILMLVTLISGQMTVNDEMVTGRGAALMAMLPGLIILPVVVFIQAFIFSGFLTLGLILYRQFRTIEVISSE